MSNQAPSSKLPLSIELVPATSWFQNVRSAVSRRQWDTIRKKVYSQAYYLCEICGGTGDKHPVECHEVWAYNDAEHIQKLEKMIALCPACHGVKHMGLSILQGREDRSVKHFMKVNKCNKKKAYAYITQAFATYTSRSNDNWTLDISHLKEYGIDVSKLRKS